MTFTRPISYQGIFQTPNLPFQDAVAQAGYGGDLETLHTIPGSSQQQTRQAPYPHFLTPTTDTPVYVRRGDKNIPTDRKVPRVQYLTTRITSCVIGQPPDRQTSISDTSLRAWDDEVMQHPPHQNRLNCSTALPPLILCTQLDNPLVHKIWIIVECTLLRPHSVCINPLTQACRTRVDSHLIFSRAICIRLNRDLFPNELLAAQVRLDAEYHQGSFSRIHPQVVFLSTIVNLPPYPALHAQEEESDPGFLSDDEGE